ncbi:glycosyltransferase family 4 protein [Helicobacter canis]|uniref:Glycosyltransferase family 4 protein n=1 Tax=Helicobacter canis TaxID=29419 RepID=A0A5M9QPT4_9HELI|nr:glycosyltransferase family 4 protein [Helicobacter canis]KAA8710089.1 glycosyltransferase family 4 protein [Helicobacter canis]
MTEAPHSRFLDLIENAHTKQELRALLLSIVSYLLKTQLLGRADIVSSLSIYERLFESFRTKILGIFERGDILDCAFLYLAFIAPSTLETDERFDPFIESVQKLLETQPSQEEYIMLIELGAIARVLANPSSQNLSFFNTNTDKYDKVDEKSLDGVMFFLSRIMCASIDGLSAGRCGEFLLELFSIRDVGFAYVKPAVERAYIRAHYFAQAPLLVRNVCNWQLHILWNAKNLFNNREWLRLYPVWREQFYTALERVAQALRDIDGSAMPPALAQWLDLALYLQFFIYHICGNSFSKQEQWQEFNTEISQYATPIYAEFAAKFLPHLPKPSLSTNKRKIIGILRDRIVENSPFKVEYSLIKNLLASPEFTQHYEIKIYCMSLIEKSENNPQAIAKLAQLGIETIDIGLGFNKAGFYNSHLQKALALREIMLKDEVAMLISPNNGYGISDFLLASRCARVQAFWTHGNFAYDISGIDARLTHICNNQKHITHSGFSFYGIPVQMDRSFYNPKVPQEIITNARACYVDSSAKQPVYLFGVIGRLVKIDSLAYLRSICAILEQNPHWSFLACGLGNEGEIKQKISQINPQLLPRFFFSGYVDSSVYGHILDFWADSFPMEQGESRIEYVAKGRGLSLRYYESAKQLESTFAHQLNETRGIIEAIIDECGCANSGGEKVDSRGENSALLHNALESTFFNDFASYKECVLGFVRETSAFSEAEYVEKATHIMRLCELDPSEYARKIAIQSAIHAVNSEIRARLGVEYFLGFVKGHL